ncbi:MAG: aldehyde dehydrogenase family protein, partial [Pseudomonadota bacterium]|nr:aldehyde dehydrogenase family protein [Pseudomonadota bacterium]
MMYRYEDFGLFIDGAWGPSRTGAVKPVIDPTNEEVLGSIPDATVEDLDRALVAAQHGFEAWRAVQPWERGAKLRRVAELVRERLDDLARIMSLETGKPLAQAQGEWRDAADQFEWYAEETKRIYGQIIEGRQSDVRMRVILQPVGV